ncbi:uncharacterized protein LOC141850879 [Brevipalpus obovatus]|uniref:uncharacterized protein LOC141850879 n=1 Tax=Brevipalpus obovatus TaxID=246614 RepID=UPI003D9E8105
MSSTVDRFSSLPLIVQESVEAEICSEDLMLEVRNYLQSREEQDREKKKGEEKDLGSISCGIERQSIREVQDCEADGINMLPDEVLWNIFEKLDGHEDMLSCEMVCRRWCRITRGIWFARQKLTIEFPEFHPLRGSPMMKFVIDAELFCILKKCPKLEEIEYRSSFDPGEITLFIIGACCRDLKRLVLSSVRLDSSSFKCLAKHYPKLKEISLPFCDYSEEDLTEYLKVANNLEGLSLVGNLPVTGKCLRHSHGIKELMLGGCRKITDKGLELVSKLKNLKCLTLNLTRVTDEEAKKILLGCPSLTFLDLSGCYRISIQTLLNAYDLRKKGLINERIVISYGGEKVNIGAISCRQDVKNLGKRLKNGLDMFGGLPNVFFNPSDREENVSGELCSLFRQLNRGHPFF